MLPTQNARSISGREQAAVFASAIITITLGCSHIFSIWSYRHQLIDGVLRCITLMCSVIALHVWGIAIYRRQSEGPVVASILANLRQNFRSLAARKCLGLAIVQQATLISFATAVLDGGQIFQLCVCSIAVFWIVLLLAASTRRTELTEMDYALVKAGFIPLLFLVAAAQGVVWDLKALR